ncbi:MAG: glucose-1-phosphate adenylyltransferase [Thermodesulfovibrionia bacterium]|nr:glucose-1-phosphate adenylyltransferase [Thermodesulfovibrionia bacterium]
MSYPKVLAMVMAGGRGERLFPLTFERSKPAVPFGGRYRIVDFVLSNLINSQIFSIYLLVQYKSQSVIEHVRENWGLSAVMSDHFVTVVPPQMRYGPDWFQGTANAVFQNLNLVRQHRPELVIVFGADHVYRIDIRQMIDFHRKRKADVTVAAMPVPISEASAFGIIDVDRDGRIKGFKEKPRKPPPMPDDPDRAYCSMGNYIFNTDALIRGLIQAERKKEYDFGKHVIPNLLRGNDRLFAYDFATNKIVGVRSYEERGYWRDVGSIKAFWDAHQDMLGEKPRIELNNELWPIRPSRNELPATKIMGGEITNSIIAEGTIINKSRIINSVIRKGVVIEDGVEVRDSIIMDNVVLKKGCILNKMIVDAYNVVKKNVHIGKGSKKPYWRAHMDPSGISVIASEKQTSKL